MVKACPDCGKSNIIEVTTLASSYQGWSFHTDYTPLLQCSDCKRVFVPDRKDYDYERDEWRE